MKIDIIFLLSILVFSLGFDFFEDRGSISKNNNIKETIEMMNSGFTQDNYNKIKEVFWFVVTSKASNSVSDLKTINNFMNAYKAYLAISLFQDIKTVYSNWDEKLNYYIIVKTDIDVKFREMTLMMKELHENRLSDSRSKAIFIELIKEKSMNINNTVENALKYLESLKRSYEKQGNNAIFGLVINALGFYFGLSGVEKPDKIMLTLNGISAFFNGASWIDSKLSIYELNEQISLVDFKLIENEEAIKKLASIESEQ